MSPLTADWSSLVLLAFLLGMKHGFDADHLATIDGLTRLNLQAGRPFARFCGALFALGHGAAVIAVTCLVGLASERWTTPAWLEVSAAWISISFLTLVGVLNLRAAMTGRPGEPVTPVGLKGHLVRLGRNASRPWLVVGTGALFAASFDTVNQAALFALTSAHFGGVGHALALSVAFTLGMMLTDGLDGLFVSTLVRRSDQLAATASRALSLAIAFVSLAMAVFCAAKALFEPVDAWAEGREMALGAAVVLIVVGAFLAGRLLAPAASTRPAGHTGR